MKTTFSTLMLCLLLSSTSFAQIRKGAVLLGGYVDASSDRKEYENNRQYAEEKRTFVSVSPVAGVFISSRWMIGLRPSIQYQHSFAAAADSSYRSQHRSTTYGIGINARYYVPVHEKFMLFTNLSGVGYSFGKGRNKAERFREPEYNYDHKYRENSYSVGIYAGLGATYFITPKIGLEATIGQIGYGFTRTESKTLGPAVGMEPGIAKNFRGNLSLNPGYFGLGLMFYLANQ